MTWTGNVCDRCSAFLTHWADRINHDVEHQLHDDIERAVTGTISKRPPRRPERTQPPRSGR